MVDAAKVLRLNDSLLQLNEQGTIDFCKNVESLFGNNFLKHVLFLGLWKIAQNQIIDVANFKLLIQETQLRLTQFNFCNYAQFLPKRWYCAF